MDKNKAIKIIKELHTNSDSSVTAALETLLPDVFKTEDEKIKQEIIQYFECQSKEEPFRKEIHDKWISWIQKQDKQKSAWSEEEIEKVAQEWDSKASVTPFYMTLDGKGSPNGVRQDIMTHKESFKAGINWVLKALKSDKPLGKTALEAAKEAKIDNANKVEPKFHKGDWIICEVTGSVYQIKDCIENVSNHKYGYDLTNGVYISGDEVNHYHTWTIQEARDGEVLVTPNKIFIYNGNYNTYSNAIGAYCSVSHNGIDLFIPEEDEEYRDCIISGISDALPATKEQRDILFTKMKEAGYEWSDEEKQLKKIPNALEECTIDHIEHGRYYYCIKDYYSGGHKRASKGEVVQALRGMDMMALGVKANEFFIPVKRVVNSETSDSASDVIQGLVSATLAHVPLTKQQ